MASKNQLWSQSPAMMRKEKKSRQKSKVGRSNSFSSDVNSSLPFADLENRLSVEQLAGQKKPKFGFLNKLKKKKDDKDDHQESLIPTIKEFTFKEEEKEPKKSSRK